MPRRKSPGKGRADGLSTAAEQYHKGVHEVGRRMMFGELLYDDVGRPIVRFEPAGQAPVALHRGLADVGVDGRIRTNPHRRADSDEWVWALTHCILHLGFGHLDGSPTLDHAYVAACCLAVTRYQAALGLGRAPFDVPRDLPNTPENVLADRWRVQGVPPEFAALGAGGAGPDLVAAALPADRPAPDWGDRLSAGIAAEALNSVRAALRDADEQRVERAGGADPNSAWEGARRWFVSAYPLLAALATGFTIVADLELARAMGISTAAVDAARAEIYVNPTVQLNRSGWVFVIAHEMLHAALRHGERVGTRDAYLWNVAADYVVNGWLVEMRVGAMPDGCLYDPALAGRPVEEVYDLITTDLRRLRKLRRLATLRGRGVGDILTGPAGGDVDPGSLDDFYRRALTLGLCNHEQGGRGLLPAALVAEIKVLSQPPLPWDAKLARWFEAHVPAAERRRSYARPSRRQASTPDIPRPGWYRPEELDRLRTFGVVLDTSGSMSGTLLGKALGAIASYSLARDVPAARVVFCDAAAYDAGYLPVETIAGRVSVRGRGGTRLQPAVNLLERAEDFPPDGPILIITDGGCDVLRVRREHAFLTPVGARLPFPPRGPVFEVS